MGRRDARGLGQNSDFGTIYLHYTIVSRKSQIKMRTRRAKSPCFSARGGREIHFGVFFSKTCKKILFLPVLARGLFHTAAPCNHRLVPMRVFTFPRFHNGFRLCKRTCLFFLFRTKIAFFRPAEHPQDTGGIWPFPALSCVKWERANFFPTVCPQGFNIHFISCPGGRPPRLENRANPKKPLCNSPILWYNVYLCTKFVEHRIGRFFP